MLIPEKSKERGEIPGRVKKFFLYLKASISSADPDRSTIR